MKRFTSIALALSVALPVAAGTLMKPVDPVKPKFELPQANKARYIVMFQSDENASAKAPDELFTKGKMVSTKARSLVEKHGGKVVHVLPNVASVASEMTPAQVKSMKNDPHVKLIELDPIRTMQGSGTSYGMAMVQANQVSDSATGNQKVCIIDTGIDINHEDLPNNGNITGEVSNTLTRDIDIGVWNNDSYGHGTHVAGTIAALNNNTGVEGVAPSGLINMHIVKVIHKSTWWYWYGSDVIDAVNKCQTAGANVINMSLAGVKNSVAEQQAIDNAYNAGTLLVGASGNRGNNEYYYPASYDSVISVGAVDQAGTAWMYTQVNDQVELAAPGVAVNSTLPGNQYGEWDGTSMATPYVSGVAALVWSHYPQCTNQQIRDALSATAQDSGATGRDNVYGHGLVQAKAAFDYLAANACDGGGSQNPPPPPTEGTNPTEPSYVTASSQYGASYGPEKVVNGLLGNNDGNVWFAAAGDENPWLLFDFEQNPRTIKSYQISKGYCPFEAYVASKWKLLASNDNSNWTLMQDVNTNQFSLLSCTEMSSHYTFSNGTAYRYYKFEFDVSNYNASVSVGEIQMYD